MVRRKKRAQDVMIVCMVVLCLAGASVAQEPRCEKTETIDCSEVSVHWKADQPAVAAYLVRPTTRGKHPAVLFLHWLGETNSDKREFLQEAEDLARAGAVSLLIDQAWSNPHWFRDRKLEEDYETSMAEIAKIHAAQRYLRSLDAVDPARIVLVGHDFGAMYGIVAMAQERGLKGCVVIAATPEWADWFLLWRKLTPEQERVYKNRMSPLDPVKQAAALNVPALFQFAKNDRYVPMDKAEEFYKAYQGPRTVRFYDTGHQMSDPAALADRTNWLRKHLGLARSGQPN